MALVGVGWNFMYTGGTTLLTESYAPVEKARVQGVNDFVLFATLAASSLTSGALVTSAGWDTANWAAIPGARRDRRRHRGARLAPAR